MEDKQLDYLIGVIYESAIDSSRWNEAMELCARYTGGILGHMLTIDKRLNQPIFSAAGGEFASLENENGYVEYYMSIDPRMTSNMMEGANIHEYRFCHDYFEKKFVAANEFYQDFLIRVGGRYSMGAWVDDSETQHSLIGLHRGVDQAVFGEVERMAAQRFSGHLQRALRLQAHTQSLQTKAELGARAIDMLALAMVIVDATGKILHLNFAAEQLLSNVACELSCKAGYLSDTRLANKNRLSGLIAAATNYPAVAGVMVLGDSEPRQVFVSPLPAASPFAHDWQIPLALVLVVEAGKALLPLQLLGKLYDFSAAELRVASSLLAGKSPEEYAEEANVTMNTVRSQLKSMFRKTNTRRQAELVAVLSRVPALLD